MTRRADVGNLARLAGRLATSAACTPKTYDDVRLII